MKVPILLALGALSTAQAAEPTGTLTLACQGTATDKTDRIYWAAFPTSTILGSRIVKVDPWPGSLDTVMSPPII